MLRYPTESSSSWSWSPWAHGHRRHGCRGAVSLFANLRWQHVAVPLGGFSAVTSSIRVSEVWVLEWSRKVALVWPSGGLVHVHLMCGVLANVIKITMYHYFQETPIQKASKAAKSKL